MPACYFITKAKFTKPDAAPMVREAINRIMKHTQEKCADVYLNCTFTEDADGQGYTCESVVKDYATMDKAKAMMKEYPNMDDYYIFDFPQNPKPELICIKEESAVCKCAPSDRATIKAETDVRRPWTTFEDAEIDLSQHAVKFGYFH